MSHAAFLRAIIAEPDDDLPRLVYADWLDEHGEPERAEFIRVQCELATLGRCRHGTCHGGLIMTNAFGTRPCPHCREQQALRRRERELVDGIMGLGVEVLHIVDGLTRGVMPGMSGYGWYERGSSDLDRHIAATLRRGFVEVVTATWEMVRTHLPAIREATPLSRVILTDMPMLFAEVRDGQVVGTRIDGLRGFLNVTNPSRSDIRFALSQAFRGLEWVLPEARIDPITSDTTEGVATIHRDFLEAVVRRFSVPTEVLGG